MQNENLKFKNYSIEIKSDIFESIQMVYVVLYLIILICVISVLHLILII